MIVFTEKQWKILHPETPQSSPVVSLRDRVLTMRGINSPFDRERFLNPPCEIGRDPFLLCDMRKACDQILDGVKNKAKILVYGDYDVDGICATVSLVLFLRSIGCEVDYIIPDRMIEGYGLGEAAVERILQSGVDWVITADCGITAVLEVRRLRQNGIRVIITDHHECKEILPEADAVVNPKRDDDKYPFKGLAGAGVALKLIQALCVCVGTPEAWKRYLDLVMLGTVGDLVPLIDENRMIVKHGLIQLNRHERMGLKILADRLRRPNGLSVTPRDIAYSWVPHINAAGRMGDGSRAAALLISEDPETLEQLAEDLICDNSRRREIETENFSCAKKQLEAQFDPARYQIMVAYDKSFHQGVAGIVASRLAEYFRRPSIVFSWDKQTYKGSARSFSEGSILDDIKAAQEHVIQFGGHKRAAGVSVDEASLANFIQVMNYHVSHRSVEALYRSEIDIEFEIEFSDLTLENAREMLGMEPFGEGNPCPLFLCRNLYIQRVWELSGGKHLKLSLLPGEAGIDPNNPDKVTDAINAIAFGFTNKDYALRPGDRVDVVFSLGVNEFNGNTQAQLLVQDLRNTLSENSPMRNNEEPERDLAPADGEIAFVYKEIKKMFGKEQVLCDYSRLVAIMASRRPGNKIKNIMIFKITCIFDIFKELSLIERTELGEGRVVFRLLETDKKVKMTDSPTYRQYCMESVE